MANAMLVRFPLSSAAPSLLGVIVLAALAAPPGAWAQAAPPARDGLHLLDAVRDALKRNASTLIQQQQVASSEGQVLQQQGAFDPIASLTLARQRVSTTLPGYTEDQILAGGITNVFQQKTIVNSNLFGISKLLPNGMTVGANYGVTSTQDNINDLLYNIQNGGRETSGKLSFTLTAPLLKNAGRDTVEAPLDAAKAQAQAARSNLLFTNSQTVLGTTIAYWGYVGARKNLEIARAAENNADILLQQVRKLVAADEIPASEIDFAVGSRSDRSATRISAEQALVDARRVLARQLGLTGEEMSKLPPAADDFPDLTTVNLDIDRDTDRLVKRALERRADLEANRTLLQATGRLVLAARNNLKPELDLSAGFSYAGLSEGSQFTSLEKSFYSNRYGPSFNISLSLQWPVGNSQANGLLVAQLAQEQQAEITVHDLESTIASNVTTQVRGLLHSVAQLREGIESVRRYTTSVQNELTKRRLGNATLLDVVNMQDRLVSAQFSETQQRQAYANAIAQLRFETGSLVRRDGDAFDFRIKDVIYPEFGPAD